MPSRYQSRPASFPVQYVVEDDLPEALLRHRRGRGRRLNLRSFLDRHRRWRRLDGLGSRRCRHNRRIRRVLDAPPLLEGLRQFHVIAVPGIRLAIVDAGKAGPVAAPQLIIQLVRLDEVD